MKGFGTFALIVGICWLVFALSMDVSVSTGAGGRVNNLGLMADRQVHTIVGGMIALAGLLIVLLGGKVAGASIITEINTRPCPLCAETIKNAAIKCKHCGSDVEAAKPQQLTVGWVASTACEDKEERDRTIDVIVAAGLPVVPMVGMDVGAGPFKTKEDARQALANLRDGPRLFSEIVYRDSVSGKYPPNFDSTESKPLYGWTVRIPDVGSRTEDVADLLTKIDLPLMTTDGGTIVTGPYESEKAAKAAVIRLGDIHNIQSNMYWVPPA